MSPTAFLTLIGGFLAVAGWLIAEVRGSDAWLRRALGIASIYLGIVSGYQIGWLGPQYKIGFYEQSLDSIRESLEAGKSSEVLDAIARYRAGHKFGNPDPVALLQHLSVSPGASK